MSNSLPEAFEKQREDAIEEAALIWIGRGEWGAMPLSVDVAKAAFRAGVEAAPSLPRVHKIGVFGYDSLVECLRVNFEQAFPGETMRDPQDAIQRLSAELISWRKTARSIE